jgi:protein phosphatase
MIAFASGRDGAVLLPASGSRMLDTHDLVFAVSDGMGGANAGDLASSLLLSRLSQAIPQTFKLAAAGFYPDCLSHLAEAVRDVHDHLNREASTNDTQGMAATVALAWFTPENLYLANVGDSRIYLARDGVLEQLSRDHTSAWAQWKRGEIGEVEYRNHPRRAALYEVVGGGHPTVRPHFAAVPFRRGDTFLICTDGLIDGLWERHIASALTDHSKSPQAKADALMNRALGNAGTDDTSLHVIEIN